ncbi:MAG: hypothetical protein QX203_15970 [Methylococcaceae bacterium]
MANKLINWYFAENTKDYSKNEFRSAILLSAIIAFIFNSLPPHFSYSGLQIEGSEGNAANQLFWLSMSAIALLIAFTDGQQQEARRLPNVLIASIPLVALCLFCVLSSAWSLVPSISLRRATLQMMIMFCVVIATTSLKRPEHAFLIVYRVANIVLFFEFIMLFNPQGFDEAGLFRGIHIHKNVLGLIAIISTFFGVWLRYNANGTFKSVTNLFFIVSWIFFLILSFSKTSMGLAFAAPIISFGSLGICRRLGIGLGPLLAIGLSGVFMVFCVLTIAGVDVIDELVKVVKEISFTGRDYIWNFIFIKMRGNWLGGYGFGGFWDIGPQSPSVRYGSFIAGLNQAHNGYLDLLLNIGMTGAILYFGCIAYFLYLLDKFKNAAPGIVSICWLILVFSLLHNFTETTILRSYTSLWIVQLMAASVLIRLKADQGKVK